jgi:hypothetical protein
VAPVNRIPSEILALIPDFWGRDCYHGYRDLVALTHVCRAWRDVFISRSSLWTDLDCVGKARTRVYLERSKSLPINLSLRTQVSLPPCHPFFEITPHAIGRLKYLYIQAAEDDIEDITTHLSRPAPLLEKLSICGGPYRQPLNAVLSPALFNGDLSSLYALKLESIRTELPWRNMANLTSLDMWNTSAGGATVEQFLDFFESAPHLRKVDLVAATPASGAQNGRLVSLMCLEWMEITDGASASLLLDHLLIPVGARLELEVDFPSHPNRGHPPRFLDNLRNLANFTDVHLHISNHYTRMDFSGPNGQVGMILRSRRDDKTCFMLESLDQFDTSKVERLKIYGCDSPSSDPLSRTLLPMKHLRTLTLDHCASSHILIHALHPPMSLSGTVVCPELEELVVTPNEGTLDMGSVIEALAARASRGAKLKTVRINVWNRPMRTDVLELKKHVLHVDCGDDIYE